MLLPALFCLPTLFCLPSSGNSSVSLTHQLETAPSGSFPHFSSLVQHRLLCIHQTVALFLFWVQGLTTFPRLSCRQMGARDSVLANGEWAEPIQGLTIKNLPCHPPQFLIPSSAWWMWLGVGLDVENSDSLREDNGVIR